MKMLLTGMMQPCLRWKCWVNTDFHFRNLDIETFQEFPASGQAPKFSTHNLLTTHLTKPDYLEKHPVFTFENTVSMDLSTSGSLISMYEKFPPAPLLRAFHNFLDVIQCLTSRRVGCAGRRWSYMWVPVPSMFQNKAFINAVVFLPAFVLTSPCRYQRTMCERQSGFHQENWWTGSAVRDRWNARVRNTTSHVNSSFLANTVSRLRRPTRSCRREILAKP